jgi:transcription elongation GreA/GreB family factor/very-short-patch-repair endonuclease
MTLQMSPAERVRLAALLRSWRDSLIDLSLRNRLLNYQRRPSSAGMDIVQPGLLSVLEGIRRGCTFAEVQETHEASGASAPRDGGTAAPRAATLAGALSIDTPASRAGVGSRRPLITLTTSKATDAEQMRHLRRLATVAREKFNDYGIWVLWLGIGFLDWKESSSAERGFSSPVVMVPVVLERQRGDSYIVRLSTNEEPVLNPALGIKMTELGIAWPRPEQVEVADAPGLLLQLRTAVAGMSGWTVSNRIVLDTFNSTKEVIYRDLLDNADCVLDNPLIRAVGLGADSGLPSDSFAFAPVELDRIDAVQPPELAPLVMDADASQRQCVAAALDRRSFVMDGPPGTGKSQTITNMIAGLLEQGRTVLFVSEKAAALDVVHNRLAEVGLSDFVLALHSNNVTRKHVAQALAGALDAAPRTSRIKPRGELIQARAVREQLSGYAAAMNQRDPQLGTSLHDVLGRIALLGSDSPMTINHPSATSELTAEQLSQVVSAAQGVARSWRPAFEGAAFSWYGLDSSSGEPLQVLDFALESLESLSASMHRHADLLAALGWDAVREARPLLAILRHAAAKDAVPEHLLSYSRTRLHTVVQEFQARLRQTKAAEEAIEKLLGSRWSALPTDLDSLPVSEDFRLRDLVPSAVDLSVLTAEAASALADRFAADSAMLADAARQLPGLARVYGLRTPETCSQALRVGRIAALAGLPNEQKPQPQWLSEGKLAEARSAAEELREAARLLDRARVKASVVFTDAVLGEGDLADVAQRFATVHRTLAGRWSSACRSDRRLVRGLLPVGAKASKAVIEALPAAVAWQETDRVFRETERRRSGVLSALWKGEETDFDGIEVLLARAREVLDLAAGLVDPDALVREIGSGGAPRVSASEIASAIAAQLSAWRDSMVPPTSPGPSYELEAETLAAAAVWSGAHVPLLRAAASVIRDVEAAAAAGAGAARPPGSWTLGEALAAVEMARQARAAIHAFEGAVGSDRAQFGAFYLGRATDESRLLAAVEWHGRLLDLCGVERGASLPDPAARLLFRGAADVAAESDLVQWQGASDALVSIFNEPRAELLRVSLAAEERVCRAALSVLDADRGGPSEWASYFLGRAALDGLYLGDLVDRAVRQGVSSARFPALVERAVLRAWADKRLAADPWLRITRGADRDDLVAEFRALDWKLSEHARARVTRACDERRPRDLGFPGVSLINRQGQLKSRHKPVRTQLDEARATVQLIKPCFMMSPLTVSRFLPPDLMFDVVIFDEASQVLPQDAVNCVYRGKALIVAGDQKQLPPTAFFTAAEDGDEDTDDESTERFESILDLCKGSGLLASLPLRWHYRSRHENLIAFSNREFYDDSMITFPGAQAEGDDVGVAFFRVPDGVYRAGSAARNNPREAEEVARRVIEHFSTRKDRSLGVVALSQSQALAIQDAVDNARRSRPDLDVCFSEGRLDGFFVKNLETVQGDERDVIIMSIGYGPDQTGKLTMRFGPMNQSEGWRRLNVAITRARYRVEVIASFDPDQMRETGSKSLNHLRRYLQYADRGPVVLSEQELDPAAMPESPFEESVLNVLQGWGYDVQPQVGIAGYRIDLGIRHPRKAGRFALGIECDGAMYHSSKAARDRDRLREGILQELGWNLHRIWGTDWYRDRANAERRLRDAVERAIDSQSADGRAFTARAAQPELASTFGQGSQETLEAAPLTALAPNKFVDVPAGYKVVDWIRPNEAAAAHRAVTEKRHAPVPDPQGTPNGQARWFQGTTGWADDGFVEITRNNKVIAQLFPYEVRALLRAIVDGRDVPVQDTDGHPVGLVQHFPTDSAEAQSFRSPIRLLRSRSNAGPRSASATTNAAPDSKAAARQGAARRQSAPARTGLRPAGVQVDRLPVEAYERVHHERARIERALAEPAPQFIAVDASALAAQKRKYEQARTRLEQRRDYLREILAWVTQGPTDPRNPIVVPGALVGITYEGDSDATIYEIAAIPSGEIDDTTTPDSPLGKALLWKTLGDQITYRTEDGRTFTVAVCSIDA